MFIMAKFSLAKMCIGYLIFITGDALLISNLQAKSI